MSEVCREIQEWVEKEVREPIERRRTERREKCKRKKCKWWCGCCNKWFCWIETFVYWVIEWVVRIVGEWVTRAVCETVNAVAVGIQTMWKILVVVVVIGAAVLLVGSIIFGAIAMSITNDGFPVWGNYCGPGHGDDPQEKPALDAVDEACKKHDKCYGDNYFGCDCDLQLLADLPAAIAEEAAKGNTAAVAAGEAILAYFSAQTPVTCTVDLGRTVGGLVEDAWNALT